jgi:uncharacterized protein YndB with AHSA1/START domain
MDTFAPVRSIVFEADLPHAPEKVWRALTDAQLVSEWLMPNTLLPVIGHRFTFKTQPIGDWDGVVRCEVLAAEPPYLLRYSWKAGSNSAGSVAPTLDSVVTWTLTAIATGTHLKLEHAGFKSPENDFAYQAMSPGWGRALQRISQIAGRVIA